MSSFAAAGSAATAASPLPDPAEEDHAEASGSLCLTFADPRLEDVFLVYTAEKNRGLTLRLHYLLAAAWAVGALKTVSQAAYGYRTGASEPRALLLHGFLLLAQLTSLAYQALAMKALKSLDRRDQLAQEGLKARLHVLLDVAVMLCVVLSDPSLPHSPTPLSTMVVTSFLTVLDMVRLDTMLRLLVAKWLCFLLLEADLLWRLPGRSLGRVGMDILSALLLGTLLPCVFAAGSEGSQREDFLRDCKRPLTNLGHWWSSVNLLLGRLPGWTPAAEEEEEHPHEE